NKVTLEGHTDAKPYSGTGSYSNWELSSDRANAARRLMQHPRLRADQVSEVRGYADQKLRNDKDPLEPSNRRITLIVQYKVPPEPDEEPKPSEPSSEKPKAGHEYPAPHTSRQKKPPPLRGGSYATVAATFLT